MYKFSETQINDANNNILRILDENMVPVGYKENSFLLSLLNI